MFGQISEHHNVAKFTHKIKDHSYVVSGTVLEAGVLKMTLRNQYSMLASTSTYVSRHVYYLLNAYDMPDIVLACGD